MFSLLLYIYISVDGGKSITNLRSFPRYSDYDFLDSLDYDANKILNQHIIKVMAFGENGEYAFLTSKRELWVGNSGSLRQVRLRPSDGYSMLNLRLFKDRHGIGQAIPFTIMFDTFNKLFEVRHDLDFLIYLVYIMYVFIFTKSGKN